MRIEQKEHGRILIIDPSAEEPAAPAPSMHESFHLQSGQGIDGDEWVKALPYARTLEFAS